MWENLHCANKNVLQVETGQWEDVVFGAVLPSISQPANRSGHVLSALLHSPAHRKIFATASLFQCFIMFTIRALHLKCTIWIRRGWMFVLGLLGDTPSQPFLARTMKPHLSTDSVLPNAFLWQTHFLITIDSCWHPRAINAGDCSGGLG